MDYPYYQEALLGYYVVCSVIFFVSYRICRRFYWPVKWVSLSVIFAIFFTPIGSTFSSNQSGDVFYAPANAVLLFELSKGSYTLIEQVISNFVTVTIGALIVGLIVHLSCRFIKQSKKTY